MIVIRMMLIYKSIIQNANLTNFSEFSHVFLLKDRARSVKFLIYGKIGMASKTNR